MPTTIDIENAKQIRESMDVYVSLDAIEYAADLTTRSASGYSVKLLETNMGEDYPMRLLADLQGDGFPLDGSCELYDENETSSYQNGKIGCRAKVGNNLGLAMSSSSMFNTIMFQGVTNCEYATFGGNQYYPDDDDNIIISVGDRTGATVVFVQDESFERVQIRRIVSGIFLSFDNETLLSVNLALRADLKPFDPSLPESEIEIRAYYPYDISKALSAVQDEKPITYRSGYDADLSEPRHFYLSETATWEKGVLTIKGVDSVHKLDGETCPIFFGNYYYWEQNIADSVWFSIRRLYIALEDQIHMAGIMNPAYDYQDNGYIEAPPMMSADTGGVPNKYVGSIIERQSHRDVIANLMNLLHLKLTKYDYEDDFWPVYVDAGIPKLTWSKPESKWDIYEADCGDVQDRLDKKVVKVNYKTGTIRHTGPTNVKLDSSVTAFKNSGISFDYDEYSITQRFYYRTQSRTASYYFTQTPTYQWYQLPANWTADDDVTDQTYGVALYDSNVGNNKLMVHNLKTSQWNNIWRTWKDWTSSYSTQWQNIVDVGDLSANATSLSLEAEGQGFTIENDTKSATIPGIGTELTLSKTSWIGEISIAREQSGGRVKILPDLGMKQLLERSNETGSFTWKGDPRMQPRDVFTFHRLTGETYDCTVESIELKHEGGGTTAQITYRRGIV